MSPARGTKRAARRAIMEQKAMSGTRGILFTDIEDSCTYWEKAGDQFADLLEEHYSMVLQEVTARKGRIVNTQGDSIFALLPPTGEAIECAVAIQRSLHDLNQKWRDKLLSPKDLPDVQVRIGVHNGQVREFGPELGGRPKEAGGPDVNVAARVMSAARGGQITVTEAAWTCLAADGSRWNIRRFPDADACPNRRRHGSYKLKGVPDYTIGELHVPGFFDGLDVPLRVDSRTLLSDWSASAVVQSYLKLGSVELNWWRLVAGGYGPGLGVTTRIDKNPPALDKMVERKSKELHEDWEQMRAVGKASTFDGARYAVGDYTVSRESVGERPTICLTLHESTYSAYQAVKWAIKNNIWKPKESDLKQPNPSWAHSLAFNLVVVDRANHWVYLKRSENVDRNPGLLGVVNEGIKRPMTAEEWPRDADAPAPGAEPDIRNIAARGLTEELGLGGTQDLIDSDRIVITSFGVIPHDYEFAFLGYVMLDEVELNVDTILRHVNRAKDGLFESELCGICRFEPKAAAALVAKHGLYPTKNDHCWTPYAVVALIEALYSLYPPEEVDDAFARALEGACTAAS